MMLSKLRTTRYLKTEHCTDQAIIAFNDQVGRTARVHQYGLSDQICKAGPKAQYPVRQLIGFSDTDLTLIEEAILSHLSL